MQGEADQRVAAEMHRIRRALRAFEDAARAEQERQLGRQRETRGAELREAITLADELRGQVTGLIVAQEVVSQMIGEHTRKMRQERLRSPGPAT